VLRSLSPLLQKLFRLNARLFDDSVERTFGHIARMVGNGGVAVGGGVEPDFMAASRPIQPLTTNG
jgi:hypothetical protein